MHTIFIEKEAETGKTNMGNVILLNQRPHAKLQLIWANLKKKNEPKSTIGWLCTRPFKRDLYYRWEPGQIPSRQLYFPG